VRGIGVSWGYHGRERLHHADVVVDDYPGLNNVLKEMWSAAS
jgi:phosphoglycolate phosphatase